MISVPAPRISPVPASKWDAEILDALNAFPAGLNFVRRSRQAGEEQPRGVNVLGLLACHPRLASAFLAFNAHAARSDSLRPRVRELVILRISWLMHSEYEFVQHRILGQRAGLTDEELEWIQTGASAGRWSPSDAAVLTAVDELHCDARIGDATWRKLQREFDERQLLDFLFVAGCYATLAMVLNSIGLPLEPGAPPLNAETRARLRARNNSGTETMARKRKSKPAKLSRGFKELSSDERKRFRLHLDMRYFDRARQRAK